VDLHSRIEALEQKVAQLENRVEELTIKRPTSPSHVTSLSSSYIPPAQITKQDPWVIPPSPAPEPKPPIDWEHLIARVWLPRIFIIVFLIGVLWGFSAAVNAGIINEPIRCLLGVAVAAVMYWQGERQVAHKRSILGQVIIGGSVAVLILSLFAAHMLYAIIPSSLAFVLYASTIVLGLYASVRHRSQTLMVLVMIAGYLVPFLVDSAEPDLRIFIAYETIFSLVMLFLSYQFAYRSAFYFAYGLLHLPLLVAYIGDASDLRIWFLTAVLVQHAVLFTLFTIRKEAPQTDRSIILFSSFGLMVLWAANLYVEEPYIYPLLIAVWSAIYSLASYMSIRWKRPFEVYLAVSTFGWFMWLVDQLGDGHLAAATIAQGTVALVLGIALKSKLQQIAGFIVFFIGTAQVWLSPIEVILSSETLAWLTLLAAVGALFILIGKMPSAVAYRPLKPVLGWAEAILFLVFLTQAIQAMTQTLSEDPRRLILSATWILYALAAIVFGLKAKIRAARLAGICLLLITLLKVIFFDLPDVSNGIRAVLFLGLGGVGVAVSRLFYKRS